MRTLVYSWSEFAFCELYRFYLFPQYASDLLERKEMIWPAPWEVAGLFFPEQRHVGLQRWRHLGLQTSVDGAVSKAGVADRRQHVFTQSNSKVSDPAANLKANFSTSSFHFGVFIGKSRYAMLFH